MSSKPITVLITGANRGIGLELVRQLAEDKGRVKKLFACCRDPNGPKAETLQTLAKQYPDIIVIVTMDVCEMNSIQEAAKAIAPLLGSEGLNLLVNNAGMALESSLQTTTTKDMQDSFNTNVIGPLNIMKEFLPHLRTAAKASKISGMSCNKAAVINISTMEGSMDVTKETYSIAAILPFRVSKAALNMLTVCAAEEMKKDKILFTVLHPGWVRTDTGGPEGEIDVQTSVKGMLKVMSTMKDKHNGAFLDYQGSAMPW
ncbi:C-factor-like [Dunckerocampus dactyliophorus]|uniref:C-factor-like n=1 Tax=Dunckerocampus dactyliophorus TaxID=161453 RepID=UPI002404CED5|nr:C-factor-like [Dunckerocampus dactyliophorus]